jgi:hypothetical protein
MVERNMGVYCHMVPGRLRVKLPGLKGSRQASDRLTATICRLPGVTEVAANPTTGSLLVLFDPRQTEHAAIVRFLRERGEIREDTPAVPVGGASPAAASTTNSASHPLVQFAWWAGGELGKEILKAALGEVLQGTPWSILLAVV